MKDGIASQGALDHGLEDSEKWRHDQTYKNKSGRVTYVPMLCPEHEKVAFKSDCSKLRGAFGDTWGYFVPSLISDSVSGLDYGLETASGERRPRGRGRPRKTKEKIRVPLPGDPDIDSGASGLVPVAGTGQTLTAAWRRVQTARRQLNSYDQEKTSGNFRQYPARGNRSRSHQTLLERKTVDLIPGFSRAIQRMIEDGKTAEARNIIDLATPKILAKFEELYPGAKASGLGWHVRSGQLHTDIYCHSTRLELVEDGVEKEKLLARLWETKGLCHYGPGPGICAWDRHARALGSDASSVAPGLKLVVEQSLERQETDYGSDANRDVRMHQAVDTVFEDLLPDSYRDRGMAEYRKWLIEQYREGTVGPKLNTASKRKAAMEEVQKVAAESKKLIKQQEEDIKNRAMSLDGEAADIRRRELAIAEREGALPAKETAAELSGLQKAFTRLFPDRETPARTVAGMEKELDSNVGGIRRDAEVRAWSQVLNSLGKAELPADSTPESLAKDAKNALVEKVTGLFATSLSKVFALFGREVPAAAISEDVEMAMTDAVEAYQADSRRHGLALAVAKVRGVEVSQVTEVDEAKLTTEIETAAEEFKKSVEVQEKDAVGGLAMYIFGGPLARSLVETVKKSVLEMKGVLKKEFERRGAAELALERALPFLKDSAPELAKAAQNLIDERPQLPDVDAVQKVAKGGKIPGRDEEAGQGK